MASGLRELISENRQSAMTAGGLLLIVALSSLTYQIFFNSPPHSPVGTAYFTLDNGNSWFPDNEDRITPFDSEGNPGLRVRLYHCKHGDFAGYLERASDQAGTRSQKLLDAAPPGKDLTAARIEVATLLRNDALIKPLGPTGNWVRKSSPEGDQIILSVKCPKDPNERVQAVDP